MWLGVRVIGRSPTYEQAASFSFSVRSTPPPNTAWTRVLCREPALTQHSLFAVKASCWIASLTFLTLAVWDCILSPDWKFTLCHASSPWIQNTVWLCSERVVAVKLLKCLLSELIKSHNLTKLPRTFWTVTWSVYQWNKIMNSDFQSMPVVIPTVWQ